MKKAKNKPLPYDFDIQWSEDDGAFVARVLEIPGCVADGKTIVEAAKNIQDVLELFLETYKSTGIMAPPASRVEYPDSFLLRLDPLLHKRLDIRAKRNQKSKNAFLNDLIMREVTEED